MHDPIQRLFRAWMERRQITPAQADQLATRIQMALSHQPLLRLTDDIPLTERTHSVWSWALAAAAVLAAIVLPLWLQHRPIMDPQIFSFIREDDRHSLQAMFRETDLLFSHDLHWVAVSGNDVHLGVDGQNPAAQPATDPMLLRVVVVERRRGEQEWRMVWNTDLLARNEELVEVPPNAGSANRLTFWLHKVSAGEVALDSRIDLQTPVRMDTAATTIQKSGIPQQVGRWCVADREYRIYQNLEPLSGGHG